MSSDEKGKSIIASYKKLVTDRQTLNSIWHECFKYVYPIRGQGFNSSDIGTAHKEAAVLFDSTATDSVRLLASSVLSALTPPHQQWFSLTINNVNDEYIPRDAKEWLEDSAELLFKKIHASNYDAQALEFFTDEMVGGMLGLYVEHVEGNFSFEVWPLASLYCAEILGRGYIDTVYRSVGFTAAEAVKRFGIDKLSDHIREEYVKDNYSTKQFSFIHTIRPRLNKAGVQAKGRLQKQLPYESIYVCEKSGHVVSESGYHEMPVIVPRWMRIPDSDYAFGPMYDALPDTKTLNKVVEFMLQNAEMAIAGMFVAKDDGVFNPNTVRIGPRRVWMATDVNNIKPLHTGGDINFAVAEISRLQNQIRRTLLADQLGPSEKSNMTATEINTRTNIIRQILGPIFGRLQAEYLVPLITRCFGLSLRNGDFGEVPASLENTGFDITYRSPLALAQKQQQLTAIDQFELRLAQKLQTNPELADLYDSESALRKSAELLGVDIALINDDQKVAMLRKKKSESQVNEMAQAASEFLSPEDIAMQYGEAA